MKKVSWILLLFTLAYSAHAQLAPNFSIKTTEQDSLHLYEDFLNKGKSVVLKLFYTTCPPCNSHAPHLQALYEEWGEGNNDVEFISLSIQSWDDNANVANFISMHGLTFPGAGSDGAAGDAAFPYLSGDFGSFFGTPTYVVIGPDGTVNFDVDGPGTNATMLAIDAAISATGAIKNAQPAGFNGTIFNRDGVGVKDISVFVESDKNGTTEIITDSAGSFIVNPSQFFVGDEIQLSPISQDEDKSGISTWDIIFIQKHILQFESLSNPYDHFAADVNNDGKITGLDIIEMRKFILGYYDEWPDNTPIQYFDANFIFDVNSDPLDQMPPNNVDLLINETNTDNIDFVALKTGDLSRGALQSVLTASDRDEKIVNINALDQDFNQSDVLKVEFTVSKLENIIGFQKRVVFDTSVLSYKQFEPGNIPGLNAANFGISKISKGEITVSWNANPNQAISFEGGELLFTLFFNTKAGGKASSFIQLASEKFDSEFYDESSNIQQIILNWIKDKDDDFRNSEYLLIHPNPSSDYVVVDYQLFDDAEVRIEIIDMTGRVVHFVPSVFRKFEQKRHIIPITDLSNGSYIVRLFEDNEPRFHQGLIIIN